MEFKGSFVVCGFPGTGKSYVTRHFAEHPSTQLHFTDFDSAVYKNSANTAVSYDTRSSTFVADDINWEVGYVQKLISMMSAYESYYNSTDAKSPRMCFFVSTHDCVRKMLDRYGIKHTIVIPGKSVTAKNEYLRRLKERMDKSSVNASVEEQEANRRAYEACSNHYDAFVSGIMDTAASEHESIVVLSDTETMMDYVRNIMSSGILGSMLGPYIGDDTLGYNAMDYSSSKVAKNLLSINATRDLHHTIGQNGEIIMWSNPMKWDEWDKPVLFKTATHALNKVIGRQSSNSAFAGCPYVMISKDDALGLIHWLEMILELSDQTAMSELLGKNIVHYERLVDALRGVNYMYQRAEQAKSDEAEKYRALRSEDKPLFQHIRDDVVSSLISKEDAKLGIGRHQSDVDIEN